MWMQLSEFQKKVKGCWMGKNIGGTLGAPFEGGRGAFDIEFYTQELGGEPLPNDDLDLQLAWLNAVEKYGRSVNASILGEYWHTYITPSWSEYGLGKNNLRNGFPPPLSGHLNNPYRDSCGAFIRSEIWACLAPGHPEIAVRYAYEDAIVDHSDDGVYGEIFCAAVQSAAFAEADKLKLIDIGLSWIPQVCGIARGVRCALESWKHGLDWKQARRKVMLEVPEHFFSRYIGEPERDLPFGPVGYDAPANVSFFVLGWLYGNDDFGRSLCTAVGCGADTDCTGATLGATLGIIQGIDGIPEKWKQPIGSKINTISLNLGDSGGMFPRTIDELSERVVRLAPCFLDLAYVDVIHAKEGYAISMNEGEGLKSKPRQLSPEIKRTFVEEVLSHQPFMVRYETPIYTAWLDYGGEPRVYAGKPLRLTLLFDNTIPNPQWLELTWHLPAGWQAAPAASIPLLLPQATFGLIGRAWAEFILTPGELNQSHVDLFVDIRSQGRHTRLVVPVSLLTASNGESA